MSFIDLIIVGVVTFSFSFGVQSLVFLKFYLENHQIVRKHRNVMQYYSGIIGDGVILPLVNILATVAWHNSAYYFSPIWLILSFIGGLSITFIAHFGQQYFSLTNWTMPAPGQWNWLGLYHAVFMFAESSFLLVILFNLLDFYSANILTLFLDPTIFLSLLLLLIFLLSFIYDYWESLFVRILNRSF